MPTRKLPKYVSATKYGYVYKPYRGTKNGKIVWGKWRNIAPPDAPMSQVWKAYEAIIGHETYTVGWLFDLYMESDRFSQLSAKSQKDYAAAIQKMKGADTGRGQFGDAKLVAVTKRTIRTYLDEYPSPVSANRHIAVFKSAWSWAEERYDIPANPCKGVTLNKEKPRQRYVTDEEYEMALQLAPPAIAQMMELAYLLRARLGEVRNLRVEDVFDDYVVLRRQKGSEGEHTMLSERLRSALSDVRGEPYVTYQYSDSAFRSAWRRLQSKLDNPFTFHDLKAKGITDHKDNHGGHRSPQMRKTYVRQLPEIPATR